MERFALILVFTLTVTKATYLGYRYIPPTHREGEFLRSYQSTRPVLNEEVSKSLYFFAPPEDITPSQPPSIYRGPPPKIHNHHQIIFIKAPEYNVDQQAALRIAANRGSPTKTIIYILSKEPNHQILEDDLHSVEKILSKPEVKFVKYRTPEDYKRTVEMITSQYDGQNVDTSALNVDKTVESSYASNNQNYPTKDSSNEDDEDSLYSARHPPFVPSGVDVVPGSSYLPPMRDRRHTFSG